MKSEWNRVIIKCTKGITVAVILFFLCIGLFTLLMLHTSLSEAWMPFYVLAAASLACFWAGLQQGAAVGKRGLLFGMLAALIVMAGLVLLCMSISIGNFVIAEFQPIQIVTLVFGGIGGVIGANLSRE